MSKKIKLGMVGGGPGANIGIAHRQAATIDGAFELLTGSFSTNAQKSWAFAEELGIAEDRRYSSYQEMLEKEAAREDGIEAVAILTPNNSHFEVSKACLEHGFHVICDKPLTTEFKDAVSLVELQKQTGLVFALTHNYSGYPMIRQAREMVLNGELGEITMVHAEHISGWAASLLEGQGHKQAVWRTKPEFAGKSTVVGDLGTHAHQLARFVTGLEIVEVSAFINTIVKGRASDDNAYMRLKLSNGATGTLWASMVATGELNGVRIRVYGEKGSLEWRHEDAENLYFKPLSGPMQLLPRGGDWLYPSSQRASRLWGGHPDGFITAFANIYRDAADAIQAHKQGKPYDMSKHIFPNVVDGMIGMKFIDAAVDSHENDGAWTSAYQKS